MEVVRGLLVMVSDWNKDQMNEDFVKTDAPSLDYIPAFGQCPLLEMRPPPGLFLYPPPSDLAVEGQCCDYIVLWLDCDKEGKNICFKSRDETPCPFLPMEALSKGASQLVLGLLNNVEMESAKTAITPPVLAVDKALALEIFTEKANRNPTMVKNFLTYCLQMPEEDRLSLLCYILDTDFSESLIPICIYMINLAERQLHDKNVGTSTAMPRIHVDLPAPQKLLARLLVLLASPYKFKGQGIAILKLLWILSQSIAPSMADVWELEIPLLIQYLAEHTKFSWSQNTWEDKLVRFLESSLKKTQSLNWSMWLSKELSHQLDSFHSPTQEKAFLYRALGVSLATGLDADRVEVLLLELLDRTDFSNFVDREGVVLACGLCAQGQVLTVLRVFREFEKRIQESQLSWQISIWQRDQSRWREGLQAVLMEVYGCVASYCHPQMLRSLVESPIATQIVQHYSSSCQDFSLKLAFLKSVIQLASALQRVENMEDFQFGLKGTVTGIIMVCVDMTAKVLSVALASDRGSRSQDLVQNMGPVVIKVADQGQGLKEILQAEPAERLGSTLRTMALYALIHLSKLKPFYSVEEKDALMDIGLHSLISIVPPEEENDSIKKLYTDAMRTLAQLMENLMHWEQYPKMLQGMVQLLEKWILSEKDWEREKALNLCLGVMQTYVRSVGVCNPLKLEHFGTLAGLIAPCTYDPHERIRVASIDVLSSLLDLHASQTSSLAGTSKKEELLVCKEDLGSGNSERIFGASARISKLVCMVFSCEEMVSLTRKLCKNMGARDLQHDKASVTWIDTFLQMRVKELEDKVAEVLSTILDRLRRVDHPDVRRHLIEGILLLAHHHQDAVLTLLLIQPLPMESHLTEVWLAVLEDMRFARTILHALVGRLQCPFSTHTNAMSKTDICRPVTVDPLMLVCTIHFLMKKMDQDDSLTDLLPEVVYTLLLQFGSSPWLEAVSPDQKMWHLVYSGAVPRDINLQRAVIKCIKSLLLRVKREGLMTGLEEQDTWRRLLENSTSFLEGIALLTRLCLTNMRSHRQQLSQLVLKGMDSDVLSCRMISTAMCVELMRSPILQQEKLLKPALLLLESGVDQEDQVLRVFSLRALGNMAHGAPKKVRKYRKRLLKKFLCCLREPSSIYIASEGMASLTKILPELREWDLGSTFDSISRQCRTFFDSENELLRQNAFVLFGKLAGVVRITKRHLFKREVKKAWVPLMLHCLDPCACTAKACMETISHCLRFRGFSDLEMVHGQSSACMEDGTVFLWTTCELLTKTKPAAIYDLFLETINYVKSSSSLVRIAACKLTGILLDRMPVRYLQKLDFLELRNKFQELQLDEADGMLSAALNTLGILEECSQHGFGVHQE
ncbi:maestro heat-like repeat-containing protein family member 2A [Rhynchocyon petersi]